MAYGLNRRNVELGFDDDEMERRALEEQMGGTFHTQTLPPIPTNIQTAARPNAFDDEDQRGPSFTPPEPPTNVPPIPPGVGSQYDADFDPTQYFGDTERRGGYVNPNATASGAAQGAAMGSRFGPYGTLIGAGAGAIYGRATRKAATQPTDFAVDDARAILTDVVRNELGREPTPGEIDGMLRSQGWNGQSRWIGEQGFMGLISNLHTNAINGGRAQPAAATTTPPPTSTTPSGTPASTEGVAPHAPPGWDEAKWNDPNHNTPKYVVGRILSKYQASPEGLRQALPEIEALFPGSKITGGRGDKIDIAGVGLTDVLRSDNTWQWHDPNSTASTSGGGLSGLGGGLSGFGGSSGVPTSSKFFEELMARARGITGGTSEQELLSRLMNG